MVNDSGIPPEAILNPYTPLAFLPPEFAGHYEIASYVHVATMAVSSSMHATVKYHFLACSLIGLHMGLAHGNAGGVHDCPQCGNYRTQYHLFFVEVSVIQWKHCSPTAHLAYEYN
jgi:hypothetical protein